MLRHDSLYPNPNSLVTFFANHDVTRFASAEGSSPTTLELAFALTLTLRGIPQFYYGDEIGMTGGGDPDNRHDFPGGWLHDPQNAFTAAGRNPEQQKVFAYVQTLLRVRREHPVLAQGHLWHMFSDESAYVFGRDSDEERIVVAFNNSSAARKIRIPLQDTPAKGSAGLAPLFGEAHTQISADDHLELTMPPQSLSIFLLD